MLDYHFLSVITGTMKYLLFKNNLVIIVNIKIAAIKNNKIQLVCISKIKCISIFEI